MASKVANALAGIYSTHRYSFINAICQTLLYGIYLCLVPIAIHVMVTNGLQSRARKWLLALTTFVFTLTTVYWILSVVFTFVFLDWWSNTATACFGSDDAISCLIPKLVAFLRSAAPWSTLLDDILLINFIIADGVIVWRAWVLCSDQSKIVLMIPVVMLVINTVIYLTTVALRAIVLSSEVGGRTPVFLSRMLDGTQIAHLTLSLSVNIFATSIIALKAWRYRKLLMEDGIGIRTPRQAIRILAVLVESGMIYILIGVMSLASIFIFLHFGLGNLSYTFLPVSTQLVGIYPIVVVLLVEKNRSLNSTISSLGTIVDVRGGIPSQTAEPLSFAPGSVHASGNQIDLSTKLPSTDIHVTFDHTLESGGVGMSPGGSKDSDSIEGHAIS